MSQSTHRLYKMYWFPYLFWCHQHKHPELAAVFSSAFISTLLRSYCQRILIEISTNTLQSFSLFSMENVTILQVQPLYSAADHAWQVHVMQHLDMFWFGGERKKKKRGTWEMSLSKHWQARKYTRNIYIYIYIYLYSTPNRKTWISISIPALTPSVSVFKFSLSFSWLLPNCFLFLVLKKKNQLLSTSLSLGLACTLMLSLTPTSSACIPPSPPLSLSLFPWQASDWHLQITRRQWHCVWPLSLISSPLPFCHLITVNPWPAPHCCIFNMAAPLCSPPPRLHTLSSSSHNPTPPFTFFALPLRPILASPDHRLYILPECFLSTASIITPSPLLLPSAPTRTRIAPRQSVCLLFQCSWLSLRVFGKHADQ